MSIIREVNIDGRAIQFEFNRFAKQANGSVMVSSGGTQVLVTVCAADKPAPGQDFFPLGVDYIEKAYSVGRIPGGYVKREGKPSDMATLTARVIDRPLRPCFPEGFQNETVITATVVSYEHGCSPMPLALAGASMALMVSDIPFEGPVAGLRLGMKEGKFIVDPLEGEEGELDLTIACKPDAVLMVEAGAKYLSNEKMLEAIEFAHKLMQPLFELQLQMQKEIGKPKMPIHNKPAEPSLVREVIEFAKSDIADAFSTVEKKARNTKLSHLGDAIEAKFNPEKDGEKSRELDQIFENYKSDFVRHKILEEKRRIDGRGLTDIRPLTCDIGPLRSAHGSSLFTRGETQSLASVTLAALEDQQRLESLWTTDLRQRFVLHYNFPPFSVGEARMQRAPGRREIGHGSLARRALEPALPDVEEFGYTIRIVSETLESNGSSSMAAVCSGTLAMLHAGVPIKNSVAGIAMGLILQNGRSAILSDILGDEDHLGDMDFKVCGTEDHITALQMDIKIGGISMELMRDALSQAQEGRRHILKAMRAAIDSPGELSDTAPRIFKLKIKADKIKDIIGPGGKTIKKITAETGVKIDVEDGGMISIVAPNATSAAAAKSLIRTYISQPQVGDVYLGKVVRMVDFGVFVELRPGVDGLCHISQLGDEKVENIEELAKVGDEMMVKIVDIDRQGRIKLSRKEAMNERPSV